MMGEVECKHVSICCWDGGEKKIFTLAKSRRRFRMLSKVERTKTDTDHAGTEGEASRLPGSACQATNQKLSSYER